MGLLVLFSCLMMAVYMVAFCIRQKGILLWVYTVAKIRLVLKIENLPFVTNRRFSKSKLINRKIKCYEKSHSKNNKLKINRKQ